jgi:DNA-binding MarR family transcriptional regulator
VTIIVPEHHVYDPPPLPAALEHRLGAALTWAAENAQEMADRALKPLGLNVRHFGVMTLLRNQKEADGESASQQAIGERLRIDRTTMVALIDDLERAGYVRRDRNPDDRRAYVITLTAAGRKAQARAENAIDTDAQHFFGRLSEPQRQQLHQLLRRLNGETE